ncbi:uncharacterized protein ISCGN_023674 [Ixodes scapularis]
MFIPIKRFSMLLFSLLHVHPAAKRRVRTTKKPSRYSLHSYFSTRPCQEVQNGPVEESREFTLHNISAGTSCPQSQAIKVEESAQSIIQDIVAGTPDLQFQPIGTGPPCEPLLHVLQGSPAQVPQAISPPTARAVCNASVSSVSRVQDPQIPNVRAVQEIPLPTVQAVQNIPVLPRRLQRIRPVPLPQLPLETMAEFDQCELALVNEPTRAAMLELMTSQGGTTVPNTTRIIMERTLRKSVQCRLSLMGRRHNKLPFKGTRICTIMCEAIHVRTKENIVEIERYLGRYLAGAPDREGGRRRRWKNKLFSV